ncbi:hypothetical protein [Flavobacterium sp. GT3R68]|uniref:hypothetical protein n=1 Tax=Flavobacterium sp. GT3R68 TaxID=2594437 RepID=UPI000F85E6D0|nr:hypothetical protein [Flavobacterium sp. GT3R68]RTY92484.1 hypothetical protein EKL32_16910 [Flavobacterium sp. GSN2]TRW94110.1 hypothetical protein FNW07_04125 [Flavobacterium sp. GT3R68]
MKTTNKILKIAQLILVIIFQNKTTKSKSLLGQLESGLFSNDTDSLLFLINAEEDEFLFI